MFTPRLSLCTSSSTIIWDIRTGIVIKDIAIQNMGKVAFSGDQRMITLFTTLEFCTYDGLNGDQICEGILLPSLDHHLGAYWVYKDTLQFAMGFKTNENFLIDIWELQPTSDPLLPVVESFYVPVPPEESTFSFSPVSFHASFVAWMEIVIFDVQDSKVLFQIKAVQTPYEKAGHFSPDGHFFACRTFQGDVCVWENTSAGYMPWGSFWPRLTCSRLLFSPLQSQS